MNLRRFGLFGLCPLLAAGQPAPATTPAPAPVAVAAAAKDDAVVLAPVEVTTAPERPLTLTDNPVAEQLQSARDTVFAQTAQAALAEARYWAGAGAGTAGSSVRFHQAVQEYQDAINTVIDDNNSAAAPLQEYRRLLAIATRAARTKDATERKDQFGNFLYDSRIYLHDHPEATRLWVMRAAASLQLNKPATGAEAARAILNFPPAYRDDPQVQKLIALIRQRGWLPAETAATPGPGKPAASAPGR
jgi:hypothetical protein